MTAAGCIFCCSVLLIAGAQAAMVSCQVMGTGDLVKSSSDWQWAAGTMDIGGPGVPNVTCAGEYLAGGYSTRVTARDGSYQASRMIDNEEIMNFSTMAEGTGVTLLREDLSVFETGGSGEQAAAICGVEGELANATAYNMDAAMSSRLIGNSMVFKSQGATIQADSEIPDQLAMQALVSGDGSAVLRSWSVNQVGIGNTTMLGYDQESQDTIRVSGRDMSAGMAFQWTSFAYQWQGPETPVEGTG